MGEGTSGYRMGYPHPGCAEGSLLPRGVCWRPGAGGRGRELLLPFLPLSHQPLQIASFVISAKTHKDKLYFLIFCFLCGKQHQLLCSRYSLKYLDVILIAHGVHIKDPPKPQSVTVLVVTLIPTACFYSNPHFPQDLQAHLRAFGRF